MFFICSGRKFTRFPIHFSIGLSEKFQLRCFRSPPAVGGQVVLLPCMFAYRCACLRADDGQVDLVDAARVEAVLARARAYNPGAKALRCDLTSLPLEEVLDVQAYYRDTALADARLSAYPPTANPQNLQAR